MPPKILPDGTAHLEGGTLPSGAAAAQMGQDRAEKDRRQQQNRQQLSLMHGVDDVIGAKTVRPCQLVEADNDKPRQRQQI